jgi:SAM-dependent methyltransferase
VGVLAARARPAGDGGLSRRYCKLCDVEDFDDPAFLAMARDVLPERDPARHIERKVWEFVMCALFLEEMSRLRESTAALAVGAGDERILFWLANRVGRVVATDIYGRGHFSDREAGMSMLEDPASHAPFPYREDRLEVQWMDARDLRFDDASFDVVLSLSSIEHFGGPGDVASAAREIGRVLRPGGHAFLATDCFVRLHPRDRAGVQTVVRAITLGRRRGGARPFRRTYLDGFTNAELTWQIVQPSGLALLQPVERSVSDDSWQNLTRIDSRTAELAPRSGSFYPHILVQVSRSVLTSVGLALQKPL